MHPKQIAYIRDMDTPYMLSHGGRGSMKTTAGAMKIAMRAMVPGAREGLYRKNLTDLKDSTLKTLLYGDGELDPILPPGTYEHNKNEKTIRLFGGGEIVYNGLSKGEASRQSGSTGKGSSLNLTGACFEEWVEVTEADMAMFDFSVRVKVKGLKNQVYGQCNPGPPSHWLAERFGLAPDTECRPGHAAHHSTIFDNPFIDAGRKALLAENYTGVAYDRYILGKWVGSDGVVYDRWDRKVHAVENSEPALYYIVGCDWGYSDPATMLLIKVMEGDRLHLEREFYETGYDEEELAELAKTWVPKHASVIVDNSKPGLIKMFKRRGVDARPCDKGPDSISYGVGMVQSKLRVTDGVPGLTVDPSCVNTIREFETYERKTGKEGLKDEYIDAFNHSMDALRYAVRWLVEERGLRVLGPDPEEVKKQEEPKTFAAMRADDPEWGW